MSKKIKFTDLLIPDDDTLAEVMKVADEEIAKIEKLPDGPFKQAAMGDANTQRQRVRKLIQSTGRVQPKTNIENDDAPPMRWR